MDSMEQMGTRFAPVILAGGSGTRFWPRSRRARAKQVLALDGDQTMIQQTLARLLPVADAKVDVWVITNRWLDQTIVGQMPTITAEPVISEPVARNTAPACALTAFMLERTEPETVIGIFPSDHVVANVERFSEVIRAGGGAGGEGREHHRPGCAADSSGDGLRVYRAGAEPGSD